MAFGSLRRAIWRRSSIFVTTGIGPPQLFLRDATAELAGLAEAPEIRRHDRLDWLRFDAESLQRAAFGTGGVGDYIVGAQQFDLVRRERQWRRHELQRQRLQ